MGQPPLPAAIIDETDEDDPLPGGAAAAAPPETHELGFEREGLAFVAGYVAFKCRHLRDDLGQPTSSTSAPASVPSRWLQTISRGSLYVPSDWWMAVVEAFELKFREVMGPTADQSPGIIKRLTACVLAVAPDLDERIARKLASTRLHLRIRWLNTARAAAQAARYETKKLMQQARSKK